MVAVKDMVSVIMPVYNAERYVAEAIESVLAQCDPRLELIVVDDGSTDGSGAIAKGYGEPVHYCFQENQGTAGARNTGIRLARGELLAFLDADDVWVENRLSLQRCALEATPDLDIVSGFVQPFHSPELDEVYRRRIPCSEEPLSGHIQSAMVIRRESFDRVGPFDTRWQIGVDMSWYVRAREVGLGIKVLPDVVLRRRLHRDNVCLKKQDIVGQRARILKESLDRRRGRKNLSGELSFRTLRGTAA